jgi:uncharacterized protein (TIGR00251 family)
VKIIIHAKTRAKEEKVLRITQDQLDLQTGQNNKMPEYKVWVKAPAVDGKANEAIIKALAEYFEITQSQVKLISGKISKKKVFEISKKSP